jgi:hypothetical protein
MTENALYKLMALFFTVGFLLVGIGGFGLFALNEDRIWGSIGALSFISAGVCQYFFHDL